MVKTGCERFYELKSDLYFCVRDLRDCEINELKTHMETCPDHNPDPERSRALPHVIKELMYLHRRVAQYGKKRHAYAVILDMIEGFGWLMPGNTAENKRIILERAEFAGVILVNTIISPEELDKVIVRLHRMQKDVYVYCTDWDLPRNLVCQLQSSDNQGWVRRLQWHERE